MRRWQRTAAVLLAGSSILLTAGCGSVQKGTDTAETTAQPETQKETEMQAEAETQKETEMQAEAETQKETETQAEAETQKEAETQAEAETQEAAAGTHTITDHAGREVEIPDGIGRIAVTDTLPLPSVLSLFLDSAESIVGMSPVSMSAASSGLLGELYPEILDADTGFFANNELNIEALLELEPDIVFYNAGSTAIEEALDNAGLTGVAVSVTKWDFNAAETYKQWLLLLEEVFPERAGLAERASEYCDRIAGEIDERTSVLTEEEKKKVFFLFNYSDTGIVTSGERFWGQYWCDAAGAVNVSREVPAEKSNALVNMEQIYAWDPEVIFISNFTSAQPEDLYTNAVGEYDWSSVSAVKEQKVYKLPLGAYRTFTPGADTPMTMLWIAGQIYPELFDDVDMTEEIRTYYKEIYGIELTDEQAEKSYRLSAEENEN